jgi:hypothetical protein
VSSLCVGIDPGGSGSIVVIGDDDQTGKVFIHSIYRLTVDTFGTPLNRWCQSFYDDNRNKSRLGSVPVYCEKVGARKGPWQAVHLINEPLMVSPQKWQKMFGLIFKKPDGWSQSQFKTWKKNQHKQYVKDKFGFDLVHAEVDAFLIAVWGAVDSGTLKI